MSLRVDVPIPTTPYFLYFTLFYCFFSCCIIYPPSEFISVGLTVENIFSKFLGNENTNFVQYHIKRTTVTLLTHSLLPLGYLLCLQCFIEVNVIFLLKSRCIFWILFSTGSTLVPLIILIKILKWFDNNWANHPLAKDIKTLYNCSNEDREEYSWTHATSKINSEYRNVDKVTLISNSVTRVIVIDNWIIKITPYKLYVAHQDQCVLIVHKTDTHLISPATRDEVQYINIEVKRVNVEGFNFSIRLNSLDFQDLQNKVRRPIIILDNVIFHRTLLDRFIDIFKEHVAQNVFYETSQDLELCIGCMQVEANVKLHRQCNDILNEGSAMCATCYCRPLWCLDCMAKWFASRQDKNLPETWLSSKCSCPVCRATFCILDVCHVRKESASCHD